MRSSARYGASVAANSGEPGPFSDTTSRQELNVCATIESSASVNHREPPRVGMPMSTAVGGCPCMRATYAALRRLRAGTRPTRATPSSSDFIDGHFSPPRTLAKRARSDRGGEVDPGLPVERRVGAGDGEAVDQV